MFDFQWNKYLVHPKNNKKEVKNVSKKLNFLCELRSEKQKRQGK